MQRRGFSVYALTAFVLLTVFSINSAYAIRDHSYWSRKKTDAAKESSKPDKNSKEKSFGTLIKDKVAIEGLFTFYRDTVDNTLLMEIKPEQIGPVYLCGLTLSRGDGAFVEGSRMFGSFPFYFKRIGKSIMMLEKNLRLRVDSASRMRSAVEAGISDALIASSVVKSRPHDSTGAVLIDPNALFVRDALNLGHFLNNGTTRTGIALDTKNSYFGSVKTFPENSEIDVHLHFKTSRPQNATALQNPYSFFHVYHYSLSSIPETDYTPRLGDDRIGYFMTIYQDYNRLDQESPYVRYINRRHLKKKFPEARISEPVEPVVFWIENTVPEEYRDAIAEGIEFWNPAFEKIGFRNAIVAKQMPDTADWDPADVRFSTFRWLVAKNNPYTAIGSSRSNPFTGQIYDADIGFVSEAIRNLYRTIERRVRPLNSDPESLEEYNPFEESLSDEILINGEVCRIHEAASEAAFGLAYLLSTGGDLADKDEIAREYVHSFLTWTAAHEVGHTLGFRHNFIASALFDMEQINDPEFTRRNSGVGTVMDYPAANIAGPDRVQGEYYPSVCGPYDNWLVEYGYSEFEASTPDEEVPQLQAIASRAGEPGLAYATDFDAPGYSMKGFDPRANIFDLGDDAIAFGQHNVNLSREIWSNAINSFEQPGERYQKIRNVFNTAWRPYFHAAMTVPRYVGGLYYNKLHIGDVEESVPLEVVPAAEQRRAMAFLRDNIFAPDAFDIPSELVNKLAEQSLPDFAGSYYRRPTNDYQLHGQILRVQQAALSRLYSSHVIGRLHNNLLRVNDDDDKYTMYDMFTDVRRSIWGEIVGPTNVNSIRRQLQLAHLERIMGIYLIRSAAYPADARTLAANDMEVLESAAREAIQSTAIDGMTKAHFKEVIRQIEAAKRAERRYVPF